MEPTKLEIHIAVGSYLSKIPLIFRYREIADKKEDPKNRNELFTKISDVKLGTIYNEHIFFLLDYDKINLDDIYNSDTKEDGPSLDELFMSEQNNPI